MITLLLTIASKGERYTANVFQDDYDTLNLKPAVWFFGDADIDWDGSPRWRRDPWGQAETTLRHNDQPIDSDSVPGIVLPPEVIMAVPGIVLGCAAVATYKGKDEAGVVFDVGPHYKLGELSACLARRLNINDDPNTGGVDAQAVQYRFWPGVPAVIEGVEYALQRYRG